MAALIDISVPVRHREKAFLIGLEREGVNKWDLRESLEELAELAKSAGAEVAGVITQHLDQPTAPYYIGKGKAEHVATLCKAEHVSSIIFDDELSPAQSRNLEQLTSRKILDRTQLILDIFAQRARTREGRLQIELAQLQYLLPRLTRMWDHLSRQTGGIGTRGPGETQLEVDRRRVQERNARLEREMEDVRKHRTIQREGRRRHRWPVAAVVGYTNAGKSTLLNRLTGAGVLAADQLFATLDPTTRQLQLPNRQKVLLTDTVGFIRKLPHTLIEAFKATLEEVREADLLIHVVDISHPQFLDQMAAVDLVVRELDAHGKQTFTVFNKTDLIESSSVVETQLSRVANSVSISAKTGEGISELIQELENQLAAWRMRGVYRIPIADTATVAEIHRCGHVLEIHYEDEFTVVHAHIPPHLKNKLATFAVRQAGAP